MNFKVFLLAALMLGASFISSTTWANHISRVDDWNEISVQEGDSVQFYPHIPDSYRVAWRGHFTGLQQAQFSLEDIKADYYWHYVVENGQKCGYEAKDSAMPNVDYEPSKGGLRFSWYDKNEPWGKPFIQMKGSYDSINLQTIKNKSSRSKHVCVLMYAPIVHVRFKHKSSYGWVEYKLNEKNRGSDGYVQGRGLDKEGRRAVSYGVKFHTKYHVPKLRFPVYISNFYADGLTND